MEENVADFVLKPSGVMATLYKNDEGFQIPLEQLLEYLTRVKSDFEDSQRKQ